MRVNKKIKESEVKSKVYSFGFDFKITEPGLSVEEARARILNECELIEGIEIVGDPNSEATSWDEDEYFGTGSGNIGKEEYEPYKPFEKVELGDTVWDQNGNQFTVIGKGTAEQLINSGFDSNGEMEESILEGLVDEEDDSVAVEYNGGTYAYVYGYEGVWE